VVRARQPAAPGLVGATRAAHLPPLWLAAGARRLR
jgi:hypothetical protein